MKKVIPIIIFSILISFQGKTQENKFLIGGTVGLKYSSTKPETTSALNGNSNTFFISGSPFFGYSISKNFMAGLAFELNVENTDYKESSYEYMNQSDYLISPFIRYYLNSFYLQAQANIGNSKQKTEGEIDIVDVNGVQTVSLDSENKHSIYGFGVGLGYDITLSEQIKLEPMIRYIFNNYKGKDNASNYKNSDIYLNLGLIYRF